MLEQLLRSGFDALGLSLEERALERFRIYFEYLEEINQVMNLTAISGEEDVARLHFLDCAALLSLEDLRGKRVADVGTGAGFPGLVLKILCPDISLTLMDSLDKRVRFLRELCEKLDFPDVECLHCRAEEAPRALRESFDAVTARAVARLDLLCELCLPLVRPGGLFIAMKGPDPEEEVRQSGRAAALLGGKAERIEKYRIPGTDVTHSAVLLCKRSPTPTKYPRRWAQIKAKPL